MSVNRESTMFGFASWVFYVPIGCRHPFMWYWQPLGAKTTATCSLLHHENKHQQSVPSFRFRICRNQGPAQIIAHKTELLTASIGKNIIHERYNTDSKSIGIANCKSCRNVLLVVENAILMRYYSQTAKTRELHESIDGPTGRPADNLPN